MILGGNAQTLKFCASKRPSIGVLRKRCSENMQQIYRRTPKLFFNFIDNTLRHGCSPLKLLHIFRTTFYKNAYGGLLLFCASKHSLILEFKTKFQLSVIFLPSVIFNEKCQSLCTLSQESVKINGRFQNCRAVINLLTKLHVW